MLPAIYPTQHLPRDCSLSPFLPIVPMSLVPAPPFLYSVTLDILGVWWIPVITPRLPYAHAILEVLPSLVHTFTLLTYIL